MYRAYPKKRGRTFKYHSYTSRGERRWYKASRYEKANRKKSTAKVLVRFMAQAIDEVDLEKWEAKMLSIISAYTDVGWYD